MDMTLLYVACLEAMGLNPIMVMMRGHILPALAGGGIFSDMIMDDPSQLEKRMSKGIHEMVVVECTAMCARKGIKCLVEAANNWQSAMSRIIAVLHLLLM